ncbi:hypothetical protein TKK_0000754 [Trichogramma kaykai]|uniref:Bis(5'-nucleosyl)-tetraphosphatase [asymmetrical] n=1 Tax=Trichogramma kaykai TaxID=54128 RepID=A0ABD2WQ95_9HYME
MVDRGRICGLFVLRRKGDSVEYLLVQKPKKGSWGPPKGRVDPGETDMDTAFRETEEEVGYDKNDLKIYEDTRREVHIVSKRKDKIGVFWIAELIDAQKEVRINPAEHSGFKWLSPQDTQRLILNCLKSLFSDFNQFVREKLLTSTD